MKTCFKCGESKPLDDFYRAQGMSDGRMGKCKVCAKADVHAHRLANPEKLKAYDRSRNMLAHRVSARKEYLQTDSGKMVHRAAIQKHARIYPAKHSARIALNNALRDGRIVKQPCSRCGSEKSEAHHPDYSKPLEVVWLCLRHHREAHGRPF